jgi:hypothetical protein
MAPRISCDTAVDMNVEINFRVGDNVQGSVSQIPPPCRNP